MRRSVSIFRFGVLFMIAALVLLTACGRKGERETDGRTYDIYYVDKSETKIISQSYQMQTEETANLLGELMDQLALIPERMEYIAPLGLNFEIKGYTLENGQLTLDFDEHYKEMDQIREILVRAAIVRTLSQSEDVQYVAFTILGEPLADASGTAIGTMTADMFIENAGNEINTYEKVNLRLYFANEEGTMLVEENQRNVVYNSNMSLEELVVQKLIEGPATENAYPTINPDTKVASVIVTDRICYVNLSEDFLTQPYNVSSAVTIYSITNSLIELSNVNKVQISINGNTSVMYRESISLDSFFERDLDLLESADVAVLTS